MLRIEQCSGEGQGSCKMCSDNGKWNVNWMCFLYRVDGYDGIYCHECVEKIIENHIDYCLTERKN